MYHVDTDFEKYFLKEEDHQYLPIFNGIGIFVGVILIYLGITNLPSMNTTSPDSIVLVLIYFALGILLTLAGIRTRKLTNNFLHWDHGISEKDKLIGMVPIVGGAISSFGFFVVFFVILAGIKASIDDMS